MFQGSVGIFLESGPHLKAPPRQQRRTVDELEDQMLQISHRCRGGGGGCPEDGCIFRKMVKVKNAHSFPFKEMVGFVQIGADDFFVGDESSDF